MLDEALPSSDLKASPGISVFRPAVPCLKHNVNIHDDSLELYEGSIIDPNDSLPDCGLVDSSDNDNDDDDDIAPKGQDHRVRANGDDNIQHDHTLRQRFR